MRRLFNIGLAIVMLGVLIFATSTVAMADGTMNRIQKTGEIRIGFREGSIPFAYITPKTGKHIGFSVDMAKQLVKYLSLHFNKKIKIVPITITPATRIPLTINGTIDIDMGSATYTQKREDVVDFSMPFFFSETTFLVAKDSGIKTLQDLNGKRIGAARGTTNLHAVEKLVKEGKIHPRAIIVTETHPQGMLALESGKIDAYSTDRSLLEGIRMKSRHPNKWRTVDFAIAYEPYGYIMRKNNSDFRDFVNDTIKWSIKTGKFFKMYRKWMGPNGVIPIPLSIAYKNYLKMMVFPMSSGWWK